MPNFKFPSYEKSNNSNKITSRDDKSKIWNVKQDKIEVINIPEIEDMGI